MKRALLIAYYFPPIGGAGAQRPAKFVRYFPDHGYEPVVITGPGNVVGRWTPRDATLSAEVQGASRVHRVAGPEPPGAVAWKERTQRWLGLRSEWEKWWVDGVVSLGLEAEATDVIYAWMSPYETAEAAARLSEKLGKPWVADLGDPWALDEMLVFPSALHQRLELQRMRRLLGSAAAVVVSTPEAVTRVRDAFPEFRSKPVLAIPNGFDAADFAGPTPVRTDDAFRIVHTGYLHTALGQQQRRTGRIHRLLGGQTEGVEIITRSHIYLLRAIDELLQRRPDLRKRIEVHLAGVLSDLDRDIAQKSSAVHLHGYLPHAESLELIRSADLLFLPMQNLPPGRRSSTVPGKTYEYLASGRPTLGAVPDGDTRDILERAGNSLVCRPDDSHAMAAAIEALVDQPQETTVPGRADFVAQFEYRELTRRIATVFDAVVGLHQRKSVSVKSPETRPVETAQNGAVRGKPKRTVAHIAYYFPPIGGAGAQRTLKFVRYLPSFGYRSVVITGSGEHGGRWNPADETLNHEVAPDTDVRRIPGPEPPVSSGWAARAERWLNVGSAWSSWWVDGVVRAAGRLEDVDVILASMSPYETAEAAADLAARLRKPWIAGLRDPWALDEMTVFPSAVHRRHELRRMRNALRTATAIVMTTNEAVDQFRRAFPEFRSKPIVSIPNGFDESDFALPVANRDDGKFRIVHTGYLHTQLGRRQKRMAPVHRILGGETRGVDILTRSHVYLLAAIDRLLTDHPELKPRLEVHLAGVLSDVDRKIAERYDVVRLHGYLAHADSIALMRSADLLFLPMQDLPAGRRSTTVPGKTYEYLASGTPILAAVPEGDARDMVAAAGNSYVCGPRDVDGMVRAMKQEVERRARREDARAPSAELLARFERRCLTEQLAEVLDSVIDLGNVAGAGTRSEASDPAARDRVWAYAT